MSLKKLFRKHLAMMILIILLFVFIGFTASYLALESESSQSVGSQPVIVARLLDRLDRTAGLSALEELNKQHPHLRFWILENDGSVSFPGSAKFPDSWDSVPHPAVPYQAQRLTEGSAVLPGLRRTIVRMNGDPARYLVVEFDRSQSKIRRLFFFSFASMVVSVILGTALSLLMLYRSLGKRVEEADYVISELQSGNLKARFPIRKRDEVGQAMLRFNRMADEIECLVERLKSVERGRVALLQELAHDLRTPIASLKSLLETLTQGGDRLSRQLRDEFTALSLKEVEYFERLVEDLLTLAQVSEPRYKPSTEWIQIESLLNDELENFPVIQMPGRPGQNGGISVKREFSLSDRPIPGDPRLLRRLFRNALENSFSFAKKSITVRARGLDQERVEVLVQDDGEGLDEEMLKWFGERRGARILDPADRQSAGRLSVGLGSVIMKAIAVAHRGEMRIQNRVDPSGRVLGADLSIILPTH